MDFVTDSLRRLRHADEHRRARQNAHHENPLCVWRIVHFAHCALSSIAMPLSRWSGDRIPLRGTCLSMSLISYPAAWDTKYIRIYRVYSRRRRLWIAAGVNYDDVYNIIFPHSRVDSSIRAQYLADMKYPTERIRLHLPGRSNQFPTDLLTATGMSHFLTLHQMPHCMAIQVMNRSAIKWLRKHVFSFLARRRNAVPILRVVDAGIDSVRIRYCAGKL